MLNDRDGALAVFDPDRKFEAVLLAFEKRGPDDQLGADLARAKMINDDPACRP